MEERKVKQTSNREVKSSAFTTYFSEPRNAAQLYSALDGVPVAPEDIRFMTLEGVLFVAKKNDLAFTAKNKVLVISEHQSTLNKNMPLRSIIYYGRTMERLVPPKSLYKEGQIPIPTPEFFVFYNGNAPLPAESVLKLSDAYLEKTDAPMLELIVRIININLPVNHELLGMCRPLYEYSWFIQRIKEYQQQKYSRDEAIIKAMEDCEREGIMVDFVREHGTEAVNMLFTQFNMEDALEVRYEEGMEKGRMQVLVQKVQRKLLKGKTLSEIAEELEEDTELVEKICHAIEACGAADDVDKICDWLVMH